MAHLQRVVDSLVICKPLHQPGSVPFPNRSSSPSPTLHFNRTEIVKIIFMIPQSTIWLHVSAASPKCSCKSTTGVTKFPFSIYFSRYSWRAHCGDKLVPHIITSTVHFFPVALTAPKLKLFPSLMWILQWGSWLPALSALPQFIPHLAYRMV